MNINEQANFIWSIADLLRGDFKQSEYGKVILPFTVLRRFDCVLAPSKAKILEANKTLTVSNKRPIFKRMTGHDYYNVSQFDFEKLMDDSNAIEANLRDYICHAEKVYLHVFFSAYGFLFSDVGFLFHSSPAFAGSPSVLSNVWKYMVEGRKDKTLYKPPSGPKAAWF